MKKTYTNKQITEAIRYWKKQLKAGNYRKVNESLEYEALEKDLEGALAARNDIPNYIKAYIHDIILDNAGHDGIGYDYEFDGIVNDLKRERVITVMTQGGANGPAVDIPTNAVPLKVTPDQIAAYVNKVRPGARPLLAEIEFDDEVGTFVYGFRGEFDDDEWRRNMVEGYETPIDLGADGDAARIYSQYRDRIYTVDSRGVSDL